jgi:hypothetical protein
MLSGAKKDWIFLASTPNNSYLIPNASGLAGSNLAAHPQRIPKITNMRTTDDFLMFTPPFG